MKVAVVTDFDGTLMEQDVGNVLMKELEVDATAQVIEMTRQYNERIIGSLPWIEIVYPMLAGRKQEVDEILDRVHLRDGARDFIGFCKEEDVPVTVLSDGMLYYIEQILKKQQVEVDQIIGNPITYLGDNQFQFGVQNENAACKWCGCCKASVVKKLKEEGWMIIYIGDGSSDYFGSGFADWIFARSSLARYLKEEGTAFYPFQTFYDVLDVLKTDWDAFKNGKAARRLNGRHPVLCKFPV
ncbi:MtnX-like HAD-IB family phosphatase [Paenibacillus sp. SYP-B3998]|uniref:MtnX-like HAD-IB family phosphatase n=1 Tax=Paenibacillus sp. SYP-B3998 TaxID=2678564 RepID=A0A6G4A7N9_9BACL|nr:MtnX-like HAD-IB family phosphatase [Paenibacillus sp. SYP-B3998]NEW09819.1 MtnX-like HAD-IB family phosphatase [Paenibacillus sp. SYP-B3998]